MPRQHSQPANVKAWDLLVRIFHWSLVLFFLVAFITEDDWLDLHAQAGYAVMYLVGFRILWGLIGAPTARFLNFVKPPSVVFVHLKSMLSGHPKHYLGHNPVAAVMVISLLLSILLTGFSGLVTLASENQGPLAGSFFNAWRGEWVEEIHEFFANFTLLLVFGHLGGVIVSSLLEGENLARAMVTGRKKRRDHWADAQQPETSHETSHL